MKSYDKVIDPTTVNTFQTWMPEELGDLFGVETPPKNQQQPQKGVPSPRQIQPRTETQYAESRPKSFDIWLPPEMDLDISPELAMQFQELEEEPYPHEDQVAELIKHQKMISNTEAKIKQLMQQAEKQAEEIRDSAYDSAYKEGLAAANAEVEQLLRSARMIAEEMYAWRESIFAQSEETIINLVLDIARTLFGSGFVLDHNRIKDVFARAVRDAKHLGNLVIRLHPEDASLIEPRWLQEQSHFSQSIKLVEDSSIKRGGCYIEGEYGQVDARIDHQFDVISGKLTDVLAVHSAKEYSDQPENQDDSKPKLAGNIGI